MGEVYVFSNNEDEPQLVERFTGVPLDSISGVGGRDCVLLNTAAGETLFYGRDTAATEEACAQIIASSSASSSSSAESKVGNGDGDGDGPESDGGGLGGGGGGVHTAAFGRKHFVASSDTGIVFTQGDSEHGQTGQGHFDDVEAPFPLKIASQIQHVFAGSNHSVALSRSGRVYAWGTGYFGQHGGLSRRPQMVPRQISFQKCKISQVAVGDDFSLALATDGRLWGWGSNDCGQLGLGDTRARFKPQVRPCALNEDGIQRL